MEALPVAEAELLDLPMTPLMFELPGRKGLVDGVGRAELLDEDGCWVGVLPSETTAGENCVGTVPARLRLVLELRVGRLESLPDPPRSGKVSSPGDSGIVSRRGVDNPLAVGGPHIDRPVASD